MFLYAVPGMELLYIGDVWIDFSVTDSNWLYLDCQMEEDWNGHGTDAGSGRIVASLCGTAIYENSSHCNGGRICTGVLRRQNSRWKICAGKETAEISDHGGRHFFSAFGKLDSIPGFWHGEHSGFWLLDYSFTEGMGEERLERLSAS